MRTEDRPSDTNVNATRIIPLGGLGEVGLNCLAIQHPDAGIVIIDAGLGFRRGSSGEQQVLVPAFSFLQTHERDIRGIVITHGHADHVGALTTLLGGLNSKLKIPLYFPKFAHRLLREELGEEHLRRHPVFFIQPRARFDVGGYGVQALRVTHSMPDSFAYAIHTPDGVVMHTGDFKIEDDPMDDESIDRELFEAYGAGGVRVLLSDSTNSERGLGETREAVVGAHLVDLVTEIQGRVFVSCFATNAYRIQSLVNAARASGRSICLVGRTTEKTVGAARALKRIDLSGVTLQRPHSPREWHLMGNQVLFVVTGSQGEPDAVLNRLSEDRHRNVTLHQGDTVIFSSRVIPGHEDAVGAMIGRLRARGARVITNIDDDLVHVTGHASRQEQADMIRWTCPETLIPIHGNPNMLAAHAALGTSLGVKTLVLRNGQIGALGASGAALLPQRVPVGSIILPGR